MLIFSLNILSPQNSELRNVNFTENVQLIYIYLSSPFSILQALDWDWQFYILHFDLCLECTMYKFKEPCCDVIFFNCLAV